MGSNSTVWPDLTEEYCIEHGVLVATSVYYRLTLTFSLIVSTLSATYTVYFLCGCYSRSLFFHRNLRTLFFSLSICCLSYSLINVFAKSHHLALSFLYTTPCQIFLPRILYALIERWIAFIFIAKYESGYTKLGPALGAGAVFISSLLVFVLFNGQNFDGWYIDGRTFPLITYDRANIVLFSLLGSNIICLILTIILHLLTPKRRVRMSLSSKFQIRENSTASKLLFWIATIQCIAYCCAQSALLYLRIYHSKDPMSPAYKENVDILSYTGIVLCIFAVVVCTCLYASLGYVIPRAKMKRRKMGLGKGELKYLLCAILTFVPLILELIRSILKRSSIVNGGQILTIAKKMWILSHDLVLGVQFFYLNLHHKAIPTDSRCSFHQKECPCRRHFSSGLPCTKTTHQAWERENVGWYK
ncbi:hypothetical protein V3C99_007640 [Haemonchus contortus]